MTAKKPAWAKALAPPQKRRSKAVQDVIAALRSDEPLAAADRERLAGLLEQKSPAHRPAEWRTPFNNWAILELVFRFLKNHEQLAVVVEAGETPEMSAEELSMVVRALEPQAAKNMNQAKQMAVEWFAQRGVTKGMKAKINNVIERTLPQYANSVGFSGNVRTVAEWERFLAFDAEKFQKS